MAMKIAFSGATDVGKVRGHNEDAYAILAERNLAMVCDGMGGHAAGEVASQIAMETISTIFREFNLNLFSGESFHFPEAISPEGRLLVGAIAIANHRIVERGREASDQSGMGTTVVACHFDDGVVTICHVGDSRAYLVRDKSIKRVTVDHSWVSEVMEKHNLTEEESENLVNKNVITRALGTKTGIRTDISQIQSQTGDLFILCSDGLTGMVTDIAILKTAIADQDNLQQLVDDLIRQANDAGGVDNISVCVAQVVEQEEKPPFEELRRVTVDWSDEPELTAIGQIAADKFSVKKTAKPNSADATGGLTPRGAKKRMGVRGLLLVILLVVVIAAVAIWYFHLV
jgi:protein phosphatase